MSLTQEQITAVQAEIASNYANLGADNIANYLNEEVGPDLITIPVEDARHNISKLVLLSYLTAQQRAGLRAALAADEDLKMLYEADSVFTTNDPVFLAMIDGLAVALSIDAETVAKIKRPGQRLSSKADALIGRKITVDEVREVIG